MIFLSSNSSYSPSQSALSNTQGTYKALSTPAMNRLLNSFIQYLSQSKTSTSKPSYKPTVSSPGSVNYTNLFKASSSKPFSFLGKTPKNDSGKTTSTQTKKNLILLMAGYFSKSKKTVTPSPKPQPKPQPKPNIPISIYLPQPDPQPQPQPDPDIPIYLPPPTPQPPTPPTPPPTPTLVAANEHAAYWGDPHVVDPDRADKTDMRTHQFDVMGEGTYNLLKDKNIQLNAEHKSIPQWQAGGVVPWVTKKIDMLIGDQQLVLDDTGNATLNGKALEKDKPFTTKDGSVLKWNGTELTAENVNNGEYNMKFAVTKYKDANGQDVNCIDTDISSTAKGVNSDGVLASGILGEGFDSDGVARTALKNAQATYLVSEADKLEATAKVKVGESQVANEAAKTAKALAQSKQQEASFAQLEANTALNVATDAESASRSADQASASATTNASTLAAASTAAATAAAQPNASAAVKAAASSAATAATNAAQEATRLKTVADQAKANAEQKRTEATNLQAKADSILTESTVAQADSVSKDTLAVIAKADADKATAAATKARADADKAKTATTPASK